MKNISILYPKSEFTSNQLQKLSFAGQLSFVESGKENELNELIRIAKGADIIAFPGESIGKRASEWLSEILEKSPNVKGLALNTTHSDYVDINYCNERGIKVTNVPDYTTGAVAEHILALLLSTAKRIIINDRRTYQRRYQPELGHELSGKTLGVIGLGLLGERIAKLGQGIGMSVIAYNKTISRMGNVRRSTLGGVISRSDAISIHLDLNEETKGILSKEMINCLKEGVIVINMSNRLLVNEKAMAEALKTGRVSQYAFEAESIKKSPLYGIETALMFKPFSSLTHEAVKRNRDAWVISICNLAGKQSTFRIL